MVQLSNLHLAVISLVQRSPCNVGFPAIFSHACTNHHHPRRVRKFLFEQCNVRAVRVEKLMHWEFAIVTVASEAEKVRISLLY